MPPAARLSDSTTHMGAPLAPGPGSLTTTIGFKPAWRAVPALAAAALQSAKQTADATIQSLETATKTAPDATSKAAALSAESAGKASVVSSLGGALSSSGGDVHICSMPTTLAPVPHGPGVVLQASTTVLVDNLPLCRVGDKVIEALGPPNPIVAGEFSVIVG